MARKPKVTVSKKLAAIQDADPKTKKKPGVNPRTRPKKPAPGKPKVSKAAAKAKKTSAAQRYYANRLINDADFRYKRGWSKFYNENPNGSDAAQKKFATKWASQAASYGKAIIKSLDSGTPLSSRVANAIKNSSATNSPVAGA